MSRSCVKRCFLWPREVVVVGGVTSEEVEEVTGQEGNRPKTGAISQLDVSDILTLAELYLCVSWLFVFPVAGQWLERLQWSVLSGPACRWPPTSAGCRLPVLLCTCVCARVFMCLLISFRMDLWGTSMIWFRSILSTTEPRSATCVTGWRSYGNAK